MDAEADADEKISKNGGTMTILALDPGNTQTGYAVISMPEFCLHDFGKVDNDSLLHSITEGDMMYDLSSLDAVAIEMVASFGMPVGCEVFETCVWIGRFHQAADHPNTHYIYRKDEQGATRFVQKTQTSVGR